MTFVSFSIKAVFVVTLILILFGIVNTKGQYKISFRDPKYNTSVHHEISPDHHKIKVGPIGDPSKHKVITLPRHLKGNWKQKVKLENNKWKGKKKGKRQWNWKGSGKKNKTKGKNIKSQGKKSKTKGKKNKWNDKNNKSKGKKNKSKGKKHNSKGKKNKGKSNSKKKSQKKKSGRIVGGQVVDPPHSLPWQVAFVEKAYPIKAACGATIICPRYVLFAAHCIEILDKNDKVTGELYKEEDWLIVAGAHNIQDKSEPSRTEHRIKKFTIHPQRDTWTFDFTVIELVDPIKMKPEAMAAHLPKENDQKKLNAGVTMVVSGWGDLTYNTLQGSAKLMFAKVPFISDKICLDTWGHELGPKSYSVFCAGYYEEGGIDACQGDSGGPLALLDEDKVKIIGVVSAGAGCGQPLMPALYAKTTLVLDWINTVTGSCNAKTCGNGNCVTGQDLGPAQRYFSNRRL